MPTIRVDVALKVALSVSVQAWLVLSGSGSKATLVSEVHAWSRRREMSLPDKHALRAMMSPRSRIPISLGVSPVGPRMLT